MISPDLLITIHHVIEDEAMAASYQVVFNFEVDEQGEPRPVTRFALDPDRFFATHADTALDFTVVALGDGDGGGMSGKTSAFAPDLRG